MVPLVLDVVEDHEIRRAHRVIGLGMLGFALMIGVMQHVAADRWDHIRNAIEDGAAQVTSHAGPSVFDAPGTTVTVSTDGGRDRILFETVSVEACNLAWVTYAPLSGPVTFDDGFGGNVIVDNGSADASHQALDACNLSGTGKSAVYPIL